MSDRENRFFNFSRFFNQIDPKYKEAFRTKVAYENARGIEVMFYFFVVFFALFMALDIVRYTSGQADGLIYKFLFVSHLLFGYQIVTSYPAIKHRNAIRERNYPEVVNMDRRYLYSIVIGQLPMAILGIFERETLVVLAIYAVMINIVTQLSHKKCINFNSYSFFLAIGGIIGYNLFYAEVINLSSSITLFMETMGIFAVTFFISRRQYNLKMREFEYHNLLGEQNEVIRIERDKSDKLLLNILPKEVADELKETGHSEAHQFENVSVLFTDFVNFTQVSEHLTPKELVAEIHTCFKAFDGIMEKYGLEKIKTIGDAYLAVSGLPTSDERHAHRVVGAALEIRNFVEKHKKENIIKQKEFLDIRMGIHSGPVVAGIVGVKKFAYDIWGDTVNTAARMEQSSEPGKITISETTHAFVADSFEFEDRGKVKVKNKGELHMYFVESYKGEKILELLTQNTE